MKTIISIISFILIPFCAMAGVSSTLPGNTLVSGTIQVQAGSQVALAASSTNPALTYTHTNGASLSMSVGILETLGVNSQSIYELTIINKTPLNGANVASFWNQAEQGCSAITFKNYLGQDMMAFGVGNHLQYVPSFQDIAYIELTGSGAVNALPFEVAADDSNTNIGVNGPIFFIGGYPNYGTVGIGGTTDGAFVANRHDGTHFDGLFFQTGPNSTINSGDTLDYELLETGTASTLKMQFGSPSHSASEIVIQNGNVTMSGTNTATAFRLPDGVVIYSGTGSPSSVVSAPVGSTYTRVDGTTGATFYVKETGTTGSSGWVAK
jgi:hypothetical protein